jgi:hypothetical protein
MHQMVKCIILLATSALIVDGTSDRASAVATAISYRRTVLDPVTTFDRCAAAAATGNAPGALDSIFGQRAASGLSSGTACQARTTARSAQGARVDSIVVGDSTAQVHVTVYRSDRVHSETYNLRRLPPNGGRTWGVSDIRVWGAVQYHARRSEPAS